MKKNVGRENKYFNILRERDNEHFCYSVDDQEWKKKRKN